MPYEPSIRVPLWVRWPGPHHRRAPTPRGSSSYLDLLPTMLEAAGFTLPAGAPRLDGESLLAAGDRTTMFSEYYDDPANAERPVPGGWCAPPPRSTSRPTTRSGAVIAREYYNLTTDPAENTNLLGDASTANDPPASTITTLTNLLNAFATCGGTACVQ